MLNRLARVATALNRQRIRVSGMRDGVAGRALLVLALVAVLAVGGWVVLANRDSGSDPDAPALGRNGDPTLASEKMPQELRVAAPISATSLHTKGLQLSERAKKMAKRMDIPSRALSGYALAEMRINKYLPSCHLSWVTLAAIGRTGSNHGRTGNAVLDENGVMTSPVGTLPLRGADGKTVDSTSAVGPMQVPTPIWSTFARAAKKGAQPNPQNIDDAALTTGMALCADNRDNATGQGWFDAVRSLRDSDLYLQRVLANANVYGTVASSKTPPSPEVLRAVRFAIGKIGLPYVWGGNGLESGDAGFDCSGLTTAAYADAGVQLPRTAHTQYHSIRLLGRTEQPRLGDLVFYGVPSKIHHVGMYIGNGQMINAPTFGQAVQVATVHLPGDDYAGAGRPVA